MLQVQFFTPDLFDLLPEAGDGLRMRAVMPVSRTPSSRRRRELRVRIRVPEAESMVRPSCRWTGRSLSARGRTKRFPCLFASAVAMPWQAVPSPPLLKGGNSQPNMRTRITCLLAAGPVPTAHRPVGRPFPACPAGAGIPPQIVCSQKKRF